MLMNRPFIVIIWIMKCLTRDVVQYSDPCILIFHRYVVCNYYFLFGCLCLYEYGTYCFFSKWRFLHHLLKSHHMLIMSLFIIFQYFLIHNKRSFMVSPGISIFPRTTAHCGWMESLPE